MTSELTERPALPHTPRTQTHKLNAFNLSAPSGSDIWRKPPNKHAFSCPTNLYPSFPSSTSTACVSASRATGPVNTIRAAYFFSWVGSPPPTSGNTLSPVNEEGKHHTRVPSVALPSQATGRQYAGGEARAAAEAGLNKWVKAGIEYSKNRSWVSTVGCDRWADWSMYPHTEAGAPPKDCIVEIRREAKESGVALWVYTLETDKDGKVISEWPVRELCWVFSDEQEGEDDGWTVRVGAYASRPTKIEGENPEDTLEVEFWAMEMERSH